MSTLQAMLPTGETQDAWAIQPQAMLKVVANERAIDEATGLDLSSVRIGEDEEPVMVARSVTVTLTYADILAGVRGNVWIDPVGFATKRAIPFSRRVRVSTVDIAFTISRPVAGGGVEHERYIAMTPPEVAAWLARWDAKRQCWPITFELTWHEEV
ncbi:hypothetical protein V5E97_06820 [Singulisphaera sp. Ch08]|uniref:Uncharacterized protein n=1 Tax=Singulisphaera sp. Ch08 TaxID=3120278 RepID=A0AAU7CM45_9BACT